MKSIQKIPLKKFSKKLKVSPVTVTRLSKKDPNFPKLERFGRSVFIDKSSGYDWLSEKSGFEFTDRDSLLTTKDLQRIFDKSHTWVWQNVKAGILPKPFKINRSNYWIDKQLDGLF